MNLDLPPSSAFAPDPAVARRGAIRHALTLTLPATEAVLSGHEPMSGRISAGAAAVPDGEALHAAVLPIADGGLTITF